MRFLRNKTILMLAAILLIVPALNAYNGGLLFLQIEPGSKSGGMAKAYVAQADDGFATYWNPGAMAFNRKTQIAAMHSNWFEDIFGDMYYEYLSWNQYFEDIGNLGVSFTYITYGEQEATDSDGDFVDTFSSYEIAMAFNYGYQLYENLGLGVNFKIVYSDLVPERVTNIINETSEDGQALAYAFDLALKHKNLFIDNLDFGLNLQNVGPDITYINKEQSDPLTMTWRMGFSYRIFDSKFNKLRVNTDLIKELVNDDFVLARIFTAWADDPFDQEIETTIFTLGSEYVYYDLLSLRAGYYYDRGGVMEGFSFGAGVHYTFNERYKFKLDFAFEEAGELTQYNKTYSIGIEF